VREHSVGLDIAHIHINFNPTMSETHPRAVERSLNNPSTHYTKLWIKPPHSFTLCRALAGVEGGIWQVKCTAPAPWRTTYVWNSKRADASWELWAMVIK